MSPLDRRFVRFLTLLTSLLACAGCWRSPEPAEISEIETLASLASPVIPGDDAPELARTGPYAVGVSTISLVNPDQPDIANFNYITRQTPRYDREIRVDVLYPATIRDGAERATYVGRIAIPDERPIPGLPETFTIQGTAVRDAAPVESEIFPLILVSHGFGNTPGALVGLTENLASKGYVVAVIDHGDYISGESKSVLRLFPRAMLFRSIDQQFVLDHLSEIAGTAAAPWASSYDASNVGLVGYSMGGYGVLNHAGAGFDAEADSFGWVGGGNLEPLARGHAQFEQRDRSALKAVVAIAPWGAQDSVGIWSDAAFADLETPLLLIVGSEDDIVGYEDGVRDIFENAKGADRYLLVFQNALHNLIQIGAPEVAFVDVAAWDQFEDPTWRKDRLIAVNQHFITAFMDWRLKGMEARRSYLDVPTVRSNDAVWEQPRGEFYGDQYANGDNGSEGYWKGFKRRQALGLEMHHLPAGSGAKIE